MQKPERQTRSAKLALTIGVLAICLSVGAVIGFIMAATRPAPEPHDASAVERTGGDAVDERIAERRAEFAIDEAASAVTTSVAAAAEPTGQTEPRPGVAGSLELVPSERGNPGSRLSNPDEPRHATQSHTDTATGTPGLGSTGTDPPGRPTLPEAVEEAIRPMVDELPDPYSTTTQGE